MPQEPHTACCCYCCSFPSPPLLPCSTQGDVPGWVSFIQAPRTRACQSPCWSPVRALSGRGRNLNTEEFPVLGIRNQASVEHARLPGGEMRKWQRMQQNKGDSGDRRCASPPPPPPSPTPPAPTTPTPHPARETDTELRLNDECASSLSADINIKTTTQ